MSSSPASPCRQDLPHLAPVDPRFDPADIVRVLVPLLEAGRAGPAGGARLVAAAWARIGGRSAEDGVPAAALVDLAPARARWREEPRAECWIAFLLPVLIAAGDDALFHDVLRPLAAMLGESAADAAATATRIVSCMPREADSDTLAILADEIGGLAVEAGAHPALPRVAAALERLT